MVNNCQRVVGGEFLSGTVSPRHANNIHPRIGSSLHIHTRVTNIENILFEDSCVGDYVINNLRMRFCGHTLAMSEHDFETDVGKVVCNEFLGCRVVFVGGDSHHNTSCLQLAKELANTLVGTAKVGIVDVVEGYKELPYALDILLRTLPLGECSLEEFSYAIAHHHTALLLAMCGIAARHKCLIYSHRKVGNTIDERAVKVENHKPLHIANRVRDGRLVYEIGKRYFLVMVAASCELHSNTCAEHNLCRACKNVECSGGLVLDIFVLYGAHYGV